MSDPFEDVLDGKAAAPVVQPVPDMTGGDPSVWTVLGEAKKDPQSQLAIASTIYNRQQASKAPDFASVVNDPANGYEAWNDPNARTKTQQLYPVGSPAYQQAQQLLSGLQSGQIKPLPYDSFYSPTAQAQDKRPKPAWDDGTGVNIGGNLFFTGKYTPGAGTPLESTLGAPVMDDASAQAAYQKAHGVDAGTGAAQAPGTDVRWLPGSAVPPGTQPTSAQAQSANFLNQYGMWDPTAVPGSSSLPLGVTEKSGVPTQNGQWYLTQDGRLQQVGSPVPDYIPAYRATAAKQNEAAAHPVTSFLAGAGQGLDDVVGSINNLTGGRLAAPELPLPGLPNDATIAQQSMAQTLADRNNFNLQYGRSFLAGAGRLLGNAAGVIPLMASGEGAVAAGGDALLNAAPRLAPIVQGASDIVAGNPLLRLGAQAARGTEQAAGTALLTSSASDRPLGEQVASVATIGAIANPAFNMAGSFANNLMGGYLSQPVSDLASTAVNKYGIPLRTGQILAANGDRAAGIADSNMISRYGTGFAGNQAAQREAFTRAISHTFGEDSPALTPEVMQAAKTRIGGVFNDVANRTDIVDADGVMDKLKGIVSDASQVLPADEITPISNQVARIEAAIDGTGQIPGENYQRLTVKGGALDRAMSSSNPNIRYYAQQVRGALDDGMIASAAPEDSAALQQARWQYKNLMTIKNLAAKAGVDGTISPTLLNGAVNTSFKNRAFTGAGDLGELSQIGQAFMKEPPQSGTAPRLAEMLKNAPAAGALIDSGIAFHDPVLALKLATGGLALGAGKVGLNALGGAYARNPLVRNMLLSGGNIPGPVGNALGVAGQIARPAYVPITVLGSNRLIQTPQPQPVQQYAP